MRNRALQLIAVAAALLLVGCTVPAGSGADDAGTDVGDSLRLADPIEPDSLSPLAAMYGISARFYEGLYTISPEGLVAELAAGAASADAEADTWTVPVADGATFSTGEPVTAEDVAATYTAAIDPDVGSPLATNFEVLEQVRVDGGDVVFELTEPYAGFDELLTVGIAPAEMVGQPMDQSPLTRAPVGSGPYQLAEWRAGQSMTLEANPRYRGPVQVQRLVVSFVSDETAISQRALAGDLDGAQLSPRLATGVYADRAGWQVWANPSADFRAVTFPRENEAFTDPRVRRAVNLGVDRQQMVDGILYGYGEPASTPFSTGQGEVFNDAAVYPYDPVAAGQLLDEAGWRVVTSAGTTGRVDADGEQLRLRLIYFRDDVLRRDLAVAFADDMADIGIAVDVEGVDRASFGGQIPDTAALFGGGDMPYHPDQHVASLLDGAYATFDPDQPYRNPSGYASDDVDELLQEGRRSLDPTARTAAYQQLQEVYLEDPAMVTLVTLQHTYVMREGNWEGLEHVLEPHEHGVAWGPWWNVEQWRR